MANGCTEECCQYFSAGEFHSELLLSKSYCSNFRHSVFVIANESLIIQAVDLDRLVGSVMSFGKSNIAAKELSLRNFSSMPGGGDFGVSNGSSFASA